MNWETSSKILLPDLMALEQSISSISTIRIGGGIVSLELKDGKPMEPYFLDENSLELVKKEYVKAPEFPELTVNLGDTVRDSLTNFQGTVVGLGYWINGCIRVGIQPRDLSKDGIPIDETWFPMKQLVVLKKSKVEKQPKEKKPGGPMKDPTSMKNPR